MTAFTDLELAALHSIFSETPQLAPGLQRQLAAASVMERENTGVGFFTTIGVADDAPPVSGPGELGNATHARIAGLAYGLGFVLFIKGGRLHLLEGYAFGESTVGLDLAALQFEIHFQPVQRL